MTSFKVRKEFGGIPVFNPTQPPSPRSTFPLTTNRVQTVPDSHFKQAGPFFMGVTLNSINQSSNNTMLNDIIKTGVSLISEDEGIQLIPPKREAVTPKMMVVQYNQMGRNHSLTSNGMMKKVSSPKT